MRLRSVSALAGRTTPFGRLPADREGPPITNKRLQRAMGDV